MADEHKRPELPPELSRLRDIRRPYLLSMDEQYGYIDYHRREQEDGVAVRKPRPAAGTAGQSLQRSWGRHADRRRPGVRRGFFVGLIWGTIIVLPIWLLVFAVMYPGWLPW